MCKIMIKLLSSKHVTRIESLFVSVTLHCLCFDESLNVSKRMMTPFLFTYFHRFDHFFFAMNNLVPFFVIKPSLLSLILIAMLRKPRGHNSIESLIIVTTSEQLFPTTALLCFNTLASYYLVAFGALASPLFACVSIIIRISHPTSVSAVVITITLLFPHRIDHS